MNNVATKNESKASLKRWNGQTQISRQTDAKRTVLGHIYRHFTGWLDWGFYVGQYDSAPCFASGIQHRPPQSVAESSLFLPWVTLCEKIPHQSEMEQKQSSKTTAAVEAMVADPLRTEDFQLESWICDPGIPHKISHNRKDVQSHWENQESSTNRESRGPSFLIPCKKGKIRIAGERRKSMIIPSQKL